MIKEYPEIDYPKEQALELSDFKEIDYYTVNNHDLPIELMMENAGLHLAMFTANLINKKQIIKIGIGNGNNGGGGLVAARRLSAWGYNVHLDIFTKITKSLPSLQLNRALSFGAKIDTKIVPDVWIDAYLGFSQRLPLEHKLSDTITKANNSNALKISLDIPTGFLGNPETVFFSPDKVLTLAAPKKILYHLNSRTELFVADLGIPQFVYQKFNVAPAPFHTNSIIKIKR